MKWEECLTNEYVNSDLLGEVGTEKVVTIKEVKKDAEYFCQQSNKKQKGLAIVFEECRPLIANATNTKTLMKLFGGANEDVSKCYGQKVILYVTTTKVAGKVVNCIRIKEYTETKCEECGSVLKPVSGKTVAQLIEISQRNTNKILCVECMKKFKAAQEGEKAE